MLALGAGLADDSGCAVQRVLSDPCPASVVRIVEGTPYTVAANTMLTIKSFASTNPDSALGGGMHLKINGADVIAGRIDRVTADLGFPIVAGPGDVVSIEEDFPGQYSVLALGYLSRL
jgi:hypothetical protein